MYSNSACCEALPCPHCYDVIVACRPAFLLVGMNATETQASLNDSIQLLSLGIVPNSMGTAPKLLPSFKGFSDDDKRIAAAYRRQASARWPYVGTALPTSEFI